MSEPKYTIGEASDETGLPESTIRYYDQEFCDYLSIERGKNNQRIFNEENLKDLEYIRYLLKREGYTVEEVKQKFASENEFKKRRIEQQDADGSIESEETDHPAPDPVEIEQYRQELADLNDQMTNLTQRLDAIETHIRSLQEQGETIRKLLDMNLERYNKLVQQIIS